MCEGDLQPYGISITAGFVITFTGRSTQSQQ
jgi:hypothetical protein